MAGTKTQFDEFLAREVQNAKGRYFPVKTGILHRLLIRKADCRSLHPNPEDEFCMPEIGPNYEIISRYQQQFLDALNRNEPYFSGEPIIVERTYPDGYMIVNGHHRWAAALQIGQPKIPIEIINVIHLEDVKSILDASPHTKRATLDLDEVVFPDGPDVPLERPLSFPWNRLYPQRIRLGVPALFHYLSERGYDIWLYSAHYYSVDSIQNLFRRYHVKIEGVISAGEKRMFSDRDNGKPFEKLIAAKYRCTLHIDKSSVLQVFSGSKAVEEHSLSGSSESWSQEVMDAVSGMVKKTEDGVVLT